MSCARINCLTRWAVFLPRLQKRFGVAQLETSAFGQTDPGHSLCFLQQYQWSAPAQQWGPGSLAPAFPGQGMQQCPALGNCTSSFVSPHVSNCSASPAGASAAASCKKQAKTEESESNCTMSTELAKADFWEGSVCFLKGHVLFCHLRKSFQMFLSKQQITPPLPHSSPSPF